MAEILTEDLSGKQPVFDMKNENKSNLNEGENIWYQSAKPYSIPFYIL